MYEELFLSTIIVSSLITILALIIGRPLAVKFGLVDYPSKRKRHEGEIPTIGGIAIFLGVIISNILTLQDNMISTVILAACTIILIIGLIDDFRKLSVTSRIIAQIIITFLVILLTDLEIFTLGKVFGPNLNIDLGFFSLPVTIIFVVFVTNSFNLMDGSDGVAAGLVLIAILGIQIVAILFSGFTLQNIIFALVSSIIPFIYINLLKSSQHKVFLGDNGSLFLGFIVAWLLIYLIQNNNNVNLPFSIVLWIIAIPIFDTTCVIIYRIKKCTNPFAPDRNHLHHILHKVGFSVKLNFIIIMSFGLALLMLGLFLEYNFPLLSPPVFIFLLFIYVWVRVYSKYSKYNT